MALKGIMFDETVFWRRENDPFGRDAAIVISKVCGNLRSRRTASLTLLDIPVRKHFNQNK